MAQDLELVLDQEQDMVQAPDEELALVQEQV